MAYDERLATRVRERFDGDAGVQEKSMFGGLAFMADGNMAVCVARDGLMVRVGRDSLDEALAHPHAGIFEMGGRQMPDWVLVAPDGVEGDDDLERWVARGAAFARSLPPK
jgi:TfoX/Sxy family transcriptional regulator of competence genes